MVNDKHPLRDLEVVLQDETIIIEDSDGDTVEVVQLDSTPSSTDNGLVTMLAAALNDVGQDELVSRIANSSGSQVDPATNALEDALKNNDADEFVTRVTGADGNEVEEVALDTTPGATDTGLLTVLAAALNDVGQDELVSRIADSTGSQVDPATNALENALKNNDTDEFVTRVTGADGNEIAEEALDTSIATTDTGLVTYLARALYGVGEGELRTTGAPRDEVTDTADGKDINSSTYTNQFTITEEMQSVTVAVDDATGSFHVEVRFQNGSGTEIVTRDNGNTSAYAGDGSTDVFIDTELVGEQCEVAVVDDSGASNTVDIAMRTN